MTVLDTPSGSIVILGDKQHDAILSAIADKRKTHLLAWYRSFDFTDDPQREIHTIEWLMKQDAMTRTEGESRIADIRRAQTILIAHGDDEPGPQVH